MNIEYIKRPRITVAVITMDDGSQRSGSYSHNGRVTESFANAMALEAAVNGHVQQTLLDQMTEVE
jgi:hypothetical protein